MLRMALAALLAGLCGVAAAQPEGGPLAREWAARHAGAETYPERREAADWLQGAVVKAHGEDSAYRESAGSLLAAIAHSEEALSVRREAIQQLGVLAVDASVASLALLVPDPAVGDDARMALEQIGTPAAAQALIAAISGVPAAVKPAVVQSLGKMSVPDVLPYLKELATSGMGAVKWAAFAAATERGVLPNTLFSASRDFSGAERAAYRRGWLRAAEHLLDQGEPERAADIYVRLARTAEAGHIQCAVLVGLAAARSEQLLPVALGWIRTPGTARCARRLLVETDVPGTDVVARLRQALDVAPGMSPAVEPIIQARLAREAADVNAVRVLPNAHAHNDYYHDRPLLDALAHGFCSIEADVFARDGDLMVAHDADEIDPERTLRALYLEPLLQRVRRYGGRVYPNGPTVYLLIDFKTGPEETWPILQEQLAEYEEMLTVFTEGGIDYGAVTVVLSGASPREAVEALPRRLASIDGRLPDLDVNPPVPLVPVVSMPWNSVVGAKYQRDPLDERARARLAEFVERAHAQNRKTRLWAAPQRPDVWDEMLAAGLDFINVDNLGAFAAYTQERRAAGGG